MTANTLLALEEKRKKLEAALERVDEEKREILALKNDVRLAIELHSILCHLAHEDQCGWDYDNWETTNVPHSARSRYLKKAQALMEAAPEKSIDELLELAIIIHRG